MEYSVKEIAERIKGLREMMELSEEDMARSADVSLEQYREMESGTSDFSFTFLYKCANMFGVDIIEILTGDGPKLSSFSVVRNGKGLPIVRRSGFKYQHLAPLFRDKDIEPFLVVAPYKEDEQKKPIALSTHKGQEFDYIIRGELRAVIDDHEVVLHEGDSVYYDSGRPHGMIAANNEGCEFLAIIVKERKDSII